MYHATSATNTRVPLREESDSIFPQSCLDVEKNVCLCYLQSDQGIQEAWLLLHVSANACRCLSSLLQLTQRMSMHT